MADLLALSARVIDTGDTAEPTNRITQELSEVADGIAVVESFSHVAAVRTDAGLVTFDASSPFTATGVVEALRRWTDAPVDTLVYTHGHLDHVGGSGALLADAASRRAPPSNGGRPRQRARPPGALPAHRRLQPGDQRPPVRVGARRALPARRRRRARRHLPRSPPGRRWAGSTSSSCHARGETDDHTWAWLPGRRTIMAGDFLIWNFPNAGNPQKVQRYPDEWAIALRAMAAARTGAADPGSRPADRRRRPHRRRARHDGASALESLVDQTLARDERRGPRSTRPSTPSASQRRPSRSRTCNRCTTSPSSSCATSGACTAAGTTATPPGSSRRPTPHWPARSRLSPAAPTLSSSAPTRWRPTGDLRLACQLAEWAALAAPDDRSVRERRAALYAQRRDSETSVMAKGIFGAAARETAVTSVLSTPLRIGGATVRNRLYRAPVLEGAGDGDDAARRLRQALRRERPPRRRPDHPGLVVHLPRGPHVAGHVVRRHRGEDAAARADGGGGTARPAPRSSSRSATAACTRWRPGTSRTRRQRRGPLLAASSRPCCC